MGTFTNPQKTQTIHPSRKLHTPINRKSTENLCTHNSTGNPQKIPKPKLNLKKNPEKEEPPFPNKMDILMYKKIHNNIKVQCNSFGGGGGGGEVGQMVTVERNGRMGGLETPKV